jgi:AcrR family transcriptional regulator
MSVDATTDDDTNSVDGSIRLRILQAALDCFMQLGITKTSLMDVARAAGVSRGTVYRYFSDRQELIDAAIELRAEKYFRELSDRMNECSTLSGQIGALGEVFAHNIANVMQHRLPGGEASFVRLSATDRDGALRRLSRFLGPYLKNAKDRGEIRRDVDIAEASEWIARVLMSMTVMNEVSVVDINKPKSVGRFMERYAVNGLS